MVDHTTCYGLFLSLLELCARTYPHLPVGRPSKDRLAVLQAVLAQSTCCTSEYVLG